MKSKEKDCNAPWFVQIRNAVLGIEKEQSKCEIPMDLEKSARIALDSALDDRQRNVLMERIVEAKTLAECSEKFSVSREMVRSIEARALRKLRRRPAVYLFIYGVEEYKRRKHEQEEFRKLRIDQKAAKYGDCSIDMLGLSTRSYNALTRNGIWTINKLFELIQEEDDKILEIRGIGFRSANEIIEKLNMI